VRPRVHGVVFVFVVVALELEPVNYYQAEPCSSGFGDWYFWRPVMSFIDSAYRSRAPGSRSLIGSTFVNGVMEGEEVETMRKEKERIIID